MDALIASLGDEFGPADLQAISRAVDEVFLELNLPDHAIGARELITRKIVELARRGERDPTKLREALIAQAGALR